VPIPPFLNGIRASLCALGTATTGSSKAIATKLIELAKAGERNPDLLCERVLEHIRTPWAQDPARLRDTSTRNEA
jgi:hypothetical protein